MMLSNHASFRARCGLATAALFLACAPDAPTVPPESVPVRARLSLIAASPTQQAGWVDSTVTASPTVRVIDEHGRARPGIVVNFRVYSGGGRVTAPSGYTDASGTVATEWTLGPEPGPQAVAAVLSDSAAVLFTAVADSFFRQPSVIIPGGGRLFRRDPDGRWQQLTPGTALDDSPAVSPDGRRVAFVRNHRIHVMNIDGSDAEPVPGEAPQLSVPERLSWSPDGTRLAFPDPRTRGISIIGVDGTGLLQLTRQGSADRDTDPSWSPDGTRIAFTRTFGIDFSEVWVSNVDGSGEELVGPPGGWPPLFQSSSSPVWSPDQRIAFVLQRSGMPTSVAIANGAGSDALEFLQVETGVGARLSDWSRDGRWIAITYFHNALRIESSLLPINGRRVDLGETSWAGPVFIDPP